MYSFVYIKVQHVVQEASSGQMRRAKDASSYFTFTHAIPEGLEQCDNSGHARCKQSSDTSVMW